MSNSDDTDHSTRQSVAGAASQNDQSLNRRAYLKLLGTAGITAATVSGMSGHAQAASDGYGEGGYGEGAYGGDSDSGVAVSTAEATNVTESTATLNGSLDDLEGASSADCYFTWRQVGADTWNTTATQTLSATGSFSEDVTGLSSGADYEYRAVADASDGDTDTGSTLTFTTSSSNHVPTIDHYQVTEAGSPNPHAEITADWEVGDADGDLAQVVVAVHDSTGMLVDSYTHAVSGSAASGTDTFKIKHVSDQTFDVTITVTDESGAETSQTETVTE